MEKDPGVESNPTTESKGNPKLIFSTNHEPINSLEYKIVKVTTTGIVSIKLFGSSKKNISIIDDGSKVFKHLVHPTDQYLKAEVTKRDGNTYDLIFRIDSEEIII